jgi:hypothetical protein
MQELCNLLKIDRIISAVIFAIGIALSGGGLN